MSRAAFAWVNGLGGVAVLGSYVVGLAMHPGSRGAVWGGVPVELQPIYTVSMLLAAAGYFPMTGYLFLRVDPAAFRVALSGKTYGFAVLTSLYAVIMVCSALWMPLTFEMVATPSTLLWVAIRTVLALTGLAVLFVGLALFRHTPVARGRTLALVGWAPFFWQTAILDAIVWPAFFPLS